MRTVVAVLCVMLGFALVVPSSAQNNPAVMPSNEYVSLFSAFCLQKFPDDSALSADAAAKGGTAMGQADLKVFLHDDPGQGWLISGDKSKYILTDEAPPYHACALRYASPQPINGNPFFAAAKAFVAGSGGSLGQQQMKRIPTAKGGNTLEVVVPVLDAKGLVTPETYIFIDDNIPLAKPDGTQVHLFDVRFVRQIHH